MTGRRDQEARPSNARPTKRDVPVARGIEPPAGTSPPAGLRGRQLEPGQGAPERHDPSQVELAVLREAETLDPPELWQSGERTLERAAAVSSQPVPSPSPTPVSVEVPRVRSVPPVESYASVGSSGKTRSVHSGTLMSVGGVDPRAATERRLEAPRMFLSQSEHEAHAYFKAKTVPPTVRPREEPIATIQIAEPGRERAVDSAPLSAAKSRAASERAGDSGRRAIDPDEADSSVPPAQRVPTASERRAPSERRVASPVPSERREANERYATSQPERSARSTDGARPTPSTDPSPVSDGSRPHADLSSFQSEERDSDFDLRGVPTDREPLARRARVASDPELRQPSWLPGEPGALGREASTLPAPPELTPAVPTRISVSSRVSLASLDLITPSGSRRRWLPLAAAALMVSLAIWLGLSARPADVSPQPPVALDPGAVRAAAPAVLQPAVLQPAARLAPAPAAELPAAPAGAPSVASPSLSASTAQLTAPSPSAKPADSAKPALSAASAPAASALAAPPAVLPSSGLESAPHAPSPRPPEAAAAPARRSIY